VVLDFETYYDDEFSLSKLSQEAYVNSEKFVPLICSVIGTKPTFTRRTYILDTTEKLRELSDYLHDLNTPDTYFVAHNMAFDGYILRRTFNLTPFRPLCTMAMSRWVGASRLAGESLRSLAKFYELPSKGDYLVNSKGKYLYQMTPEERRAFAQYCAKDTHITYLLFKELVQHMTVQALDFISMTLKMYIEPKLQLSQPLLDQYLKEMLDKQNADWQRLQHLFSFSSREEFMQYLRSPAKFQTLLERLGVPAPMKVSEARVAARSKAMIAEKQGEVTTAHLRALKQSIMIPALAKTDPEFMDLTESANEDVSLLCRARLEHNSSQAVSRAKTFLDIATRGVPLSVPLSPYKAMTGRYSARVGEGKSDATNLQNLPMRTGGGQALRQAIHVPEGYKLVAADSGQIECRMLAYISGQDDILNIFRKGECLYSEMAEALSNIPAKTIYEGAKLHNDQTMFRWRDIGKRLVLGCGYNMSGKRFAELLQNNKVKLSEQADKHTAKATEYVYIYRERFPKIKAFWKECQKVLEDMYLRYMLPEMYHAQFSFDPFFQVDARRLLHADADGMAGIIVPTIYLPNKFPISYIGLDQKDGDYFMKDWRWGHETVSKLYGGSITAHLTQGTSFALISHQGLEINKRYPVVGNTHDKWIAMVPAEDVAEAEAYLFKCMTTPATWCRDLPLSCEVSSGTNYEIA
jgi:DNA polymerase